MAPLRPHANCYWLEPGLVMAGEYPGARDLAAAKAKLRACVDAGVRHFLDLTEPRDRLEPYAPLLAELALPIGYERHGLPDMDVPTSHAQTAHILDRLDALTSAATPTYLHCWGGIGRTGLIAGCWLVRRGRTGEAALAEIATHWTTVEKRTRQPQSPQTEEQRQYVLGWAKRDPRLAGTSRTPPAT